MTIAKGNLANGLAGWHLQRDDAARSRSWPWPGVYLDQDTIQTNVIDDIGHRDPSRAQRGDLLLDLDSGNKLKKYGIDLSAYRLIYDFDPAVSNGHIYRREAQ